MNSQQTLGEIEKKQQEIDRVIKEVNAVCADDSVDEDDAMMLRDTLKELNSDWNELRSQAFEKQIE